MLKPILLGIGILLISSTSQAQQTIYSWRDANGVVIYSDVPPTSDSDVRDFKILKLTSGNTIRPVEKAISDRESDSRVRSQSGVATAGGGSTLTPSSAATASSSSTSGGSAGGMATASGGGTSGGGAGGTATASSGGTSGGSAGGTATASSGTSTSSGTTTASGGGGTSLQGSSGGSGGGMSTSGSKGVTASRGSGTSTLSNVTTTGGGTSSSSGVATASGSTSTPSGSGTSGSSSGSSVAGPAQPAAVATPVAQAPTPATINPPAAPATTTGTMPVAPAPTPTASTPASSPAAAAVATPVAQAPKRATYGNPGPIAPEYFGMHIHWLEPNWTGHLTNWPQLPFGSWRLWDAYTAWPNLEPKQGNWQFQGLDQYIAMAHNHGLNDILLPLAMSPTWASARPGERCLPYETIPGCEAEPANIQTWRTYVRTVAQRYKGVIRYYEIWNEPNPNAGFFSGTVDAMVSLACAAYQEIKAVDPTATVVSPSAVDAEDGVQWLDDFLLRGGGKCIDVVGYHFYNNGPEDILDRIDKVGAVMLKNGIAGKPLWNTETGYYIANASVPVTATPLLSDTTASAYLMRNFILAAWKGVERFYWYGLDGFDMALVEPDNTQALKRAGAAFGLAQTWLTGMTVSSCSVQPTNIWVCELDAPDGSMRHVVWKTDGPQSWVVPTAWGADRAMTMSGTVISPAAGGGVVQISPLPIIVN
jgi:hypothetical protein